jgi:DNA repair protein RAD5
MLDLIGEMAPNEKAVIFSEWTSYLDIIATELQKEGHTFAHFVGSMKPAERSEAIKRFSDDDAPRFLLCSIGSAGVGINLTRANVAFLMSPFWNSAQEHQAMDRIHRLGQEQDIRVYRLVMAGSIEERMIKYQEAKVLLCDPTCLHL